MVCRGAVERQGLASIGELKKDLWGVKTASASTGYSLG